MLIYKQESYNFTFLLKFQLKFKSIKKEKEEEGESKRKTEIERGSEGKNSTIVRPYIRTKIKDYV